MSEMLERVAKAIHEKHTNPDANQHWFHEDAGKCELSRQLARAALEAMREPTDAMCDAAEWHQQSDVNQYQAAIDQALEQGAK